MVIDGDLMVIWSLDDSKLMVRWWLTELAYDGCAGCPLMDFRFQEWVAVDGFTSLQPLGLPYNRQMNQK